MTTTDPDAFSPAVEAVFNQVHPDIAQAIQETIETAADRDFAADMVRIAYDLGCSLGRLQQATDHAKRERA